MDSDYHKKSSKNLNQKFSLVDVRSDVKLAFWRWWVKTCTLIYTNIESENSNQAEWQEKSNKYKATIDQMIMFMKK